MTAPFVPSNEYPNLSDANNSEKPTMMNDNPEKSSNNPTWFSTFAGAPQTDLPPNGNGTAAQNAAAWIGARKAGLKPWSEFFNTKKFNVPSSTNFMSRLQHNLSYFFSNYLCVFIGLLIYCVLTSFVLLLTVIALGGLFYSIRQRTSKGPVVPASLLYTLALVICIPLFAIADVGQVVYWVFGSSVLVIFLHSVLYDGEELPGQEFEVVTVA
ncbi:Prenylated Rab acceptor protein 1 isoform X2 [Aphelenchoides besseyi]|nr:Prenylated Rab acceptor protein 1 isoform X2 [Aphelenchoides besseyi]